MNSVKIRVLTLQTIDSAGNEDEIELVTEGTIEKIDDFFVINYDESDITETAGSRTKLKIYKNKMIMTKLGVFSSKMEFEKDKKYSNIYVTPYGSFDIDFLTVKFENCLNQRGIGTIEIEYEISFANSDGGYNKLKIDIIDK